MSSHIPLASATISLSHTQICFSQTCLLIPLDLPSNIDYTGFPNSSVGKESACNAGDPNLIPGSGRSTGEGIGYPPQYSWASLVAQLVKNPPEMRRPRFNSSVSKIHWRRDRLPTPVFLGFPYGSAGEESTCNAGDLSSIPGLGRSLEKGKATHCSILAWRIPGTIKSMGSQRIKHD